jgi:crotonobetaine/carnitine-CoA ligase
MSAALQPLEVLRLYPPHRGTLDSLLATRAQTAPERKFLWYQGHSVSYAQAVQQVARTAAMLAARGIGPGDRVGVMSANHPSTVYMLLALARLGAVMVGVNPDYGVAEAQYVLGHAGVSGVLCSPQALPTAQQACSQAELAPWFLVNEAAEAGVATFADALDAAPELHTTPVDDPQATCIFIYTSGTTGFPKGVMHSQRNLVMAGEGFVERMHLQPHDRMLCVLPMFHINAICYSLGGAMAAGATLILEPRFSASRFWQVVQASGATEVNTIAAASGILLRRPRSEYVALQRGSRARVPAGLFRAGADRGLRHVRDPGRAEQPLRRASQDRQHGRAQPTPRPAGALFRDASRRRKRPTGAGRPDRRARGAHAHRNAGLLP